jgi:low affinity Fe/Cu permease
MNKNNHTQPFFERLSNKVTKATGSTRAFLSATTVILIWLATGPIFHFSDTWQLFINTGTTIITFLMVFLIQKSQNKESMAIQLKLNELVAAHQTASNRLVNIEDMTEEELVTLHRYYKRLSELAMKEKNIRTSHSIEEAEELHEHKQKFMRNKKPAP